MKRNRPQSASPGGQSQRQLRVGEMLRHALSAMLNRGDLRDPDLAGKSVTVTEGRAAPFLKRQVAAEVELRYVPSFSFTPDTSFDQANRIDALLKDAARSEGRD